MTRLRRWLVSASARQAWPRRRVIFTVLLVTFVAAPLAGWAYEQYAVRRDARRFPPPGQVVDAGGRRLHLVCVGSGSPVVVLEPKLVYRTARGSVPEGEHVVELGHARLARRGTDVTLVAWGAMVDLCERAAEALAGITVPPRAAWLRSW